MKILSLVSIEQRIIDKQKDHTNDGEKTQKY